MSATRTCDCMTCRKCYERERARKVYRLRAYGQWDPHGDLEAVRAHLDYLRTHRVGVKRIHELTGISRNTAYRIRAGKAKRVSREVAERLLAVQPDQTLRVNPTGTARRIRALMAIGWSTYEQADRLGMTQGNLWELSKARYWVAPETAQNVRDLYDELCMTPGPSEVTRARAAAVGHVPPLGWENIDDPDEKPNPGATYLHTPRTDVDEAVVLRVMAGERLPMTTAERVEVVARLRARGWSLNEIETRCHIGKPERYTDRGAA